MRKLTRLISALTIVCMLFTLLTFNVSAADDTFTLTVTVPAKYASGTVSLYVGGVAHNGTSGTLTAATSEKTLADGSKLYTYEGISSARTMYLSTKANGITKKRTYYFGDIPNVIGSTQNVVGEFYDNPGSTAWRTSQVITYTHAMNDYMQVPNTKIAQDIYNKYVADTPYFQRILTNPLQMSKQSERIPYIKGMDEADDNLYFFENIQRSYGSASYYMNLVVFTKSDIPAGATMDEVAEIVKANGKPTILYKGQIHGNEQAPGEATLAMVKALDSDYGEEILNKVNVLIIPRVSAYGAYGFDRDISSPNGAVNPNRDCMRSITSEMTGTHKVFYKFMPEIVMDAHEYTPHTSATAVVRSFPDISYAVGTTLNTTKEMADLGKDFVIEVRDRAIDAGLFPYIYDDTISDKAKVRYSAYKTVYNHPFFSQLGCVSFLIESPGGCGPCTGEDWIERRVTSHFVAAKAIFDYAAANATKLKSSVKAARDKIIADGATFDEDDMFVLQHDTNNAEGTEIEFERLFYDIRVGKVSEADSYTTKLYPNDKAARSRTRATAYFIPKAGDWLKKDTLASVSNEYKKLQYERALETLDKHSVKYYELPAGTSVVARQYKGTVKDATLLPEKVITFENGGYVVPMNQVAGNVIGGLFEPDVTDNSGDPGTFMQQKLYSAAEDGTLPVYRYERDLNTTDLTYGGVTTVSSNAPENLVAVHKTTVDGNGSITGLDHTKFYEYATAGETAYTIVREGATKISNLKPDTYYVRHRYADGSFGADVAITIEDQYTGAILEVYNADLYNTYAMAGSKVLFKALSNAEYYRNGTALTNVTAGPAAGTVALPVVAGSNSFYAVIDGERTNIVNIYGATMGDPTIYKNLFTGGTAYGNKFGWKKVTDDGSNPTLFDGVHTDIRQQGSARTYHSVSSVDGKYEQALIKFGFYVDDTLAEDSKLVTFCPNNRNSYYVRPEINTDMTLDIVSSSLGTFSTGITLEKDKWYSMELYYDINVNGRGLRQLSVYLDGMLVASGIEAGSTTGALYIYTPNVDSNLYFSSASISTVETTANPAYNLSGTIAYDPTLTIEQGETANTVKVTGTELNGLENLGVRLFVDGEMLDASVATDGTPTAIELIGYGVYDDAKVYAAVVDDFGNIVNGLFGPLQTETIVMDITTTAPVAPSIFSGSIASGKVKVMRSEFPEAYKTATAQVIEIKADGTLVATEFGSNETTKEVPVTTTSRKVFLWILSKLYPLCEAIVE